jgi:hypothetical protein
MGVTSLGLAAAYAILGLCPSPRPNLQFGGALSSVVAQEVVQDPAHKPQAPKDNAGKTPEEPKTEFAMLPGSRITATTSVGTITITADDELTRSYTWEGATRSVEMGRRRQRWYGSLGIAFPGPGNHWKEHHGITRGVLEEGQQHFNRADEAIDWIKKQNQGQPHVYRDDGLVVGWDKTLPRAQLNVSVWQILIDGKKPQSLPGSDNDAIVVSTVKLESVNAQLVDAVRRNNAEKVKALLNDGADANTESAGSTVLMLAATRGYAPVVQVLLDKKADLNRKGDSGATPLIGASEHGHVEIVKLLLAKGASVRETSDSGMEKGATALIEAAQAGHSAVVKTLLDAKSDPNAHQADGKTALHAAALFGHKDVIELLLENGAEIDSRDWLGATPLFPAVLRGNLEIVKLLVAKGANVNAKMDASRIAASRASFSGDTQAGDEAEKSGKLKVQREDGPSVLTYARLSRKPELLQFLQQAGAK